MMSTDQAGQIPRVMAIIVNWNTRDDVLECIASLQQSGYRNLEICVVDNASTDGSVEAIQQRFPFVFVIQNNTNVGFGRACNIGLEYGFLAGADYFFLLNSDLVIDANAINVLVGLCESDPSIGLAGPVMYIYSKPNIIQQFGGMIELAKARARGLYEFEEDDGQLPAKKQVTFIGGGILFLRRRLVERIGGFDPIFFLYGEEVDLELRAMRAGYKMFVASEAKVWHKMYGSFGGRANATVKRNYFRSWMILGRRYARGSGLVIFCFHYFINRLARSVIGSIKRGEFNLINPVLRGAWEGVRIPQDAIAGCDAGCKKTVSSGFVN